MLTGILQSLVNFQNNIYFKPMAAVNENLFNFKPGILSKDACIVIVHTEWNAEIVNKLLDGCVKNFNNMG